MDESEHQDPGHRRSIGTGSVLLHGNGGEASTSERAHSGHRRFPRAVLRRVAFVAFAQRVGFSLEEVRAALGRLPADRIPTGSDWAALSGAWTERIDRRMAELERLRAELSGCIGCGCLSVEKCPLANPGDRAGRRGPGLRVWVEEDPSG